jgi:hypothetical protein
MCTIQTLTYQTRDWQDGASAETGEGIGGFDDFSPPMTNTTAQRVLRSGHTDAVWRVVAVGHRVFSASRDSTVRCWSGPNFRCCAVLTGHTDEVLDLVVHHRGHGDGDTALFTSSADGTCRMWRMSSVPDDVAVGLDPMGAVDVRADAVADVGERVMHFCVAGVCAGTQSPSACGAVSTLLNVPLYSQVFLTRSTHITNTCTRCSCCLLTCRYRWECR